MRTIGLVLLLAAGILATGCESSQPAEPDYYPSDWPDAYADQGMDGFSSTLLFNRDGSAAQAYAQRAGWPRYVDYGKPGQQVFYREWFIDWQQAGRNARNNDFTFRRFETVREGYRDR
jgi:hypothetical protein